MGLVDAVANFFKTDQAPPPRDLGRNDACWCGSGKKYKKCHLPADEKMLAKSRSSCARPVLKSHMS